MLKGQNSQLLAEIPALQRYVMKQLLSAFYASNYSHFLHVAHNHFIMSFLSDRSRKADQVVIFGFGAIPVAFILQFIF